MCYNIIYINYYKRKICLKKKFNTLMLRYPNIDDCYIFAETLLFKQVMFLSNNLQHFLLIYELINIYY